MRAAILRRIPFCNKKGNFRNISYEKSSKVFSQNSRSYGEFYSVIADSYGNVPVMLLLSLCFLDLLLKLMSPVFRMI